MTDVTATPVEEVKEEKEEPAKVAKPKYEGPSCSVCGKPLTDPESVKAGIGPLCRAKGWTKELVAAKMATLKKDVVPEGWRKLSELSDQLRIKGIPVARMVRAVGGDRGMEPCIPGFEVVYVGRARYLAPWCFGPEAENILNDKNLGKPAPEKKVKEPKAPKLDADGKPIAPKAKTVKATIAPNAQKANVSDIWTKGK